MSSMPVRYVVFLLIFLITCNLSQSQVSYAEQRVTMVRSQIKARGITDRATLKSMAKVPRHSFVPEKWRMYAYADNPLPIGEGQTISQPFMVAYMTQAVKLKPDSKVLEIGTGSGYQAAILAEITDQVYTIEIVEPLGLAAKDRLKAMGYKEVEVRIGDGYNGWPEKAPFDAIIVTAGAETIPQPLIDQLADGGRMVIPVGPHGGIRQLIRLTKKGDRIKKESLMAVRFVPFTRAKQNKKRP